MNGKLCLITGGARGMGRETAFALAERGARVALLDWAGEEGARTRDEINRRYGRGRASFYLCDLSDLDQCHSFAQRFRQEHDSLDVLINNAGITYPEYRVSPQGNEFHFAICHLAHFFLTSALLPMLEASAAGRIVVVSSEAHKSCESIDFDDLHCARYWKGKAISHTAAFRAYSHAKLCNILFMRELHERLQGSTVTVNAVSPGFFVNTGIHREMRGIFRFGSSLVFGAGQILGLNTPQKGARSHIYAASSAEVTGLSGCYFEQCREKAMSPEADNNELRKRLWTVSESLVSRPL